MQLAILDRPPKLPSIERVALTPEQQEKWDNTRFALMWKCPAFTHILYMLLDTAGSKHVAVFTKVIPTAAVDGFTLFINPDWFFRLTISERVFVTAHEIMHCILNHMLVGWTLSQRGEITYADSKKLKYNHQQINAAMDFVINAMLVHSGIGVMPKEGCYDPSIASGNDSFLDVYRKIYSDDDGGGGGGGGGGFDQHLEPGSGTGKSPTQAKADRNEGEWRTQIAAAMNVARVQGKLPAGLERLLNEILEPKVDWRDHIQALFARRLGSGSYDWRRPDRALIVRDIYAPGRSGFGAEHVVVAIDTSGSIGLPELNMFMAEVSGIFEDIRPKRLSCVMCDAQINVVHELNDASELRDIKLVGGGGTNFIPVFDWIADQGGAPDALVYLTDGLGMFPDRAPNYPVIWGSIYEPATYPFGDVVQVPKTK
jgi:predicted metal-dependent peptidase